MSDEINAFYALNLTQLNTFKESQIKSSCPIHYKLTDDKHFCGYV